VRTNLAAVQGTFTGEACLWDWIETTMLNALAGCLPPQPDRKAFYYGDYRLSGAPKQYYWHEWPSCSGSYIQLMAEYRSFFLFSERVRCLRGSVSAI
jgi:hypothetical protein